MVRMYQIFIPKGFNVHEPTYVISPQILYDNFTCHGSMKELCPTCKSHLVQKQETALIAISGLWPGKGKVSTKLDRLEIREPGMGGGRKVFGYISHDKKLIMSDYGDVWVLANQTGK